MRVRILGLIGAAALVVACSGSASPAAATGAPADLTVFGAASLRDALEAAATAWETANPGSTITLATDSSAALATQIAQGAPADVFLAADTTTPGRLVDGGLADGPPIAFAGNELAIIVPRDNPAGIDGPADLAEPGVRIIAAGDEVPITTYATRIVANLAALDGYPADFAAAYAANVVSREDNVRSVVAKIGLGEGDAGIVYATDAVGAVDVATIDVPDGANVRASYAGIVIADSPAPDAARGFLAWLAGPDGQSTLARFGFLPPE